MIGLGPEWRSGTKPPIQTLTTATLLGGSGSRAAQATPSVFPLAGEFKFERGTKYPSPSGNHYLIFQTDGNLCVYTKDARFVWGLSSARLNRTTS